MRKNCVCKQISGYITSSITYSKPIFCLIVYSGLHCTSSWIFAIYSAIIPKLISTIPIKSVFDIATIARFEKLSDHHISLSTSAILNTIPDNKNIKIHHIHTNLRGNKLNDVTELSASLTSFRIVQLGSLSDSSASKINALRSNPKKSTIHLKILFLSLNVRNCSTTMRSMRRQSVVAGSSLKSAIALNNV